MKLPDDYRFGCELLSPGIRKIADQVGVPGMPFTISETTMERVLIGDDYSGFVSTVAFLMTAAALLGCEETNGVVVI